MRKGFTLIELMVASLLLGMLATILTMIFNQSSIAWRIGTTGVANLNDSRAALGVSHDVRDDVLPGVGNTGDSLKYRTVSLWQEGQNNKLRTSNQRAFNFDSPGIKWGRAQSFTLTDAEKAKSLNVVGEGQNGNQKSGYSVGVRSLGPDGQPDTEDDINTWPEEID